MEVGQGPNVGCSAKEKKYFHSTMHLHNVKKDKFILRVLFFGWRRVARRHQDVSEEHIDFIIAVEV
jgi:hypothetical protein